MGQEINQVTFKQKDFDEFNERLKHETKILKHYFESNALEKSGSSCGFELEGWLLDAKKNPIASCEAFLDEIKNPQVVPELSLFNFEYNSHPHQISKNLLTQFHQELTGFLTKAKTKAKAIDCDVTMIGTLPTLKKTMLAKKNIHPNKRYTALDNELKKIRGGKPIEVEVSGKELLQFSHTNVLAETVSTSVQIHLQMQASKAVRYYNASQIISAPMVAIAANSPFLFGKSVWEETRIPIFEQVVGLGNLQNQKMKERVTFGSGYVKESMFEMFLENLKYEILMPAIFDSSPDELKHLRFHNGTIWRWNRPLIDLNSQGIPHVRLEHRVAAAGPTTTDVIANVAFFLGIMRFYAYCRVPPEAKMSFSQAKKNFYKAAEFGLDAKVHWLDCKNIKLRDLILEVLLPQARQGLVKLNIDSTDIDFYLDEVIKPRVLSGQTGSKWQQEFIKKNGADFNIMMSAYQKQQCKDIPVHEWVL